MLNVLRCQLTYQGQAETNAEAWFNIALRPRKPERSLGRTAQFGHLDSHTAPELLIVHCFLGALRPRRRDGLLGTGTEWEGDDSEGSTAETARKRPERPWTAATENNGSVKAVSPRHCPATCALRNCCFNCCAWTESQGQCSLHCC